MGCCDLGSQAVPAVGTAAVAGLTAALGGVAAVALKRNKKKEDKEE